MARKRTQGSDWPDTLIREDEDGLKDAAGNPIFCETEVCEHQATAEVRVSVRTHGDQVRRYCASCHAAYGSGVQHAMFLSLHPGEKEGTGRRHYILHVVGCVDPLLAGPFGDGNERNDKARQLRNRFPDSDAFFWLDVAEDGIPTVGAYSAGFMDGSMDDPHPRRIKATGKPKDRPL